MIKLVGTALSGSIGEQIDAVWVSAAHIRNARVADPAITAARDGLDRVISLTVQEEWYGSNHSYRYK